MQIVFFYTTNFFFANAAAQKDKKGGPRFPKSAISAKKQPFAKP
jgi:hypothetical protein